MSDLRSWARADPAEYRALPLRAHELLARVPLHDVWRVDLPHHGVDYEIDDVRSLLTLDSMASINPAVRALFALRGWLGRVFRWESGEPDQGVHADSYLRWLTPEDREESQVNPGTPDPPFIVLYVRPHEAASEIRNATVHAFSVLAMKQEFEHYRLYWAIYVSAVGRLTPFYMALIDPFRCFIVYPSVLRHVHRTWCARHPGR